MQEKIEEIIKEMKDMVKRFYWYLISITNLMYDLQNQIWEYQNE